MTRFLIQEHHSSFYGDGYMVTAIRGSAFATAFVTDLCALRLNEIRRIYRRELVRQLNA